MHRISFEAHWWWLCEWKNSFGRRGVFQPTAGGLRKYRFFLCSVKTRITRYSSLVIFSNPHFWIEHIIFSLPTKFQLGTHRFLSARNRIRGPATLRWETPIVFLGNSESPNLVGKNNDTRAFQMWRLEKMTRDEKHNTPFFISHRKKRCFGKPPAAAWKPSAGRNLPRFRKIHTNALQTMY